MTISQPVLFRAGCNKSQVASTSKKISVKEKEKFFGRRQCRNLMRQHDGKNMVA